MVFNVTFPIVASSYFHWSRKLERWYADSWQENIDVTRIPVFLRERKER